MVNKQALLDEWDEAAQPVWDKMYELVEEFKKKHNLSDEEWDSIVELSVNERALEDGVLNE